MEYIAWGLCAAVGLRILIVWLYNNMGKSVSEKTCSKQFMKIDNTPTLLSSAEIYTLKRLLKVFNRLQ